MDNIFDKVEKIVIETDEENPTVIVTISGVKNESEPIQINGNYRVRFSFVKD